MCAVDVFIAGEGETTAGVILEKREKDRGREEPQIKRGRVKKYSKIHLLSGSKSISIHADLNT